MKKFLLSAAIGTVILAGQAHAEQPAIDEEAMKAWIMSNPEIIVAALQKYEQDQREAETRAVEGKALAALPALLEGAPYLGNPDGDFDIVMFSDYSCPHCRNAHGELAKLLAEDKGIRVTIRELPILGERSNMAARYALAVEALAGAESYEALHERTFQAGAEFDEAWIKADIEALGLDEKDVIEAMSSEPVEAHLGETMKHAQDIGIRGTPFLIIGDQPVAGGLPFEAMKGLVGEIRAAVQE